MKAIYQIVCLGTVIATLSSCSVPAEPAPPPIGNPYITRKDFDGDKRSWQHNSPIVIPFQNSQTGYASNYGYGYGGGGWWW
jgi:hypothetical protein